MRNFVKEKNISHIINCAAYNDVDKAESETDKAFLLNRDAPGNLAKVAKEIGAVFATYSTDFVFDGTKGSTYTEEDQPNPISVYAASKYQGEQKVLSTYKKSFVIRTSWVFGMGNNNFTKLSLLSTAFSINDVKSSLTSHDSSNCFFLIVSTQYCIFIFSGNESIK